jgi:hypothetical protein
MEKKKYMQHFVGDKSLEGMADREMCFEILNWIGCFGTGNKGKLREVLVTKLWVGEQFLC